MNMEEIIVYGGVFAFCALIFGGYLWVQSQKGKKVQAKIQQAKIDGVHEPVSLYPFIDPNACIGSGACVTACPEKDILGIVNGRAQLVNASSCIGHGACFHACS
jgi:NAD-dependent dihydropyrimidine dehydrogenase PreA subunit